MKHWELEKKNERTEELLSHDDQKVIRVKLQIACLM